MRTALSILCIIVGLLMVAVGVGIKVFQHYTDPARLRAQALEAFAEAVEARLEIGEIGLSLPNAAGVTDVALTPPGAERPVFAAPRVTVSLNAASLLRLEPVPEAIDVHEPTIYVDYDPETRRYNFDSIVIKPTEEPMELPEGLLNRGVRVHNATVVVRDPTLYEDQEERTYRGLQLTITPDPSRPDRWMVQGRVTGGLLDGATVGGWVGGTDKTLAYLTIRADHMEVGEDLWGLIPFGRRIWRDFKPAGMASCAVRVEIEGRESHVAVAAHMEDCTGKIAYYPVPVRSVSGTIIVTEDMAVVQSAEGVVDLADLGMEAAGRMPARVRVNGRFGFYGETNFVVEINGVPLTRQAVETIPADYGGGEVRRTGLEIWDRLRPSGTAGLNLMIRTHADGRDAEVVAVTDVWGAHVDALLSEGEASNGDPPRRLRTEGVTGRVVYAGGMVHLRNVQAWALPPYAAEDDPQRVRISVNGVYDPSGQATALDVKAEDVRTNESFVELVPELGRIWEHVRPEINMDVEASVRAGNARLVVDVHGGTAITDEYPVPLEQITGSMVARVGKDGISLAVERLHALLPAANGRGGAAQRAGSLEVSGLAQLEKQHYELSFHAENVVLSERLLTARKADDFGTRLWQMTHPDGTVSVTGRFVYDGSTETGASRFRSFADIDLKDVSGGLDKKLVEGTAKGRIPFAGAAGHLLVSEGRAVCNQVTGIICGGRFDGSVVAYYGAGVSGLSYGATLHVSDVQLEEVMRQLAPANGKTTVKGLVDGTIDLGGVVDLKPAGGQNSGQTPHRGTVARGKVTLSKARLWETPVFAQLLPLLHLSVPDRDKERGGAGNAEFRYIDGTLYVDRFSFSGGGLNFTGSGTIGADRTLKLDMVAIGAKEDDRARIPVLSDVVGWVVSGVESQLFRVEIRGTLDKPEYNLRVVSALTAPLRGLGNILVMPFGGS